MIRITRASMEELQSLLPDLEQAASDIADPIDTWIEAQDDPALREERGEARDEIEDNLGGLEDACYEVLALLAPKRIVR
jgi:hypothetical protein